SAVTYTSVYTSSKPWRYYGEDSTETGPPRVIVYGYDRLPIQPVAPPSLDYVLGLEHPPSPDYVDYPADGGDGDDEPSNDDDDVDTDDEDPEEDDKEEEEHSAPADSSAVPIGDVVLSAGETEALEADEPTHAPGSPSSIPFFRHIFVGHGRLSDQSHPCRHLWRHASLDRLSYFHHHYLYHLYHYLCHLHSPLA
nr:hypothetical protein [Tanacetum cinerariifolium]